MGTATKTKYRKQRQAFFFFLQKNTSETIVSSSVQQEAVFCPIIVDVNCDLLLKSCLPGFFPVKILFFPS